MYSKLSAFINRNQTIDFERYAIKADAGVDTIEYNPYVLALDQRVFAQLGDLVFTMSDGISRFGSQTGYQYAQQAIVTGKPTLQGIGEKLTTLDINMSLYRFLGVEVEPQIALLKTMQASGEAHSFLTGQSSGEFYTYSGKYVIESIREAIDKVNPLGVIEVAHLSIRLMESVDRETVEVTKIEKKPKRNRNNVNGPYTPYPARVSEEHKALYQKALAPSVNYWGSV